MVYRIYVEKKPGFDVEAEGLKKELVSLLGVAGLTGLRLLNRYDVEGIDEALFEQCASTVFSEPPVDNTYAELPQSEGVSFAVEYLPGQFDQRADSAAECIQLISQGERPLVRSATYAGIAAKRVSGKPLVVHMHATEFDRSGEHVNQSVYNIERAGMEAADRVIAVSNLTRNIVIEKYGIPADKVVTVHNAVRFDKRDSGESERNVEDKIVTFLGRITYQKGPDYFVEAAAKVLKRLPNVRFVMAGSGDMLVHVIRRVAKLGIADRFHFTGFLRGDEVQKMFGMSDVYVMPSVSEPFGISPLEAMKSNVPVIISKQSGVAEVLDYAIKVDYWDVDAMADAIYGLLKYPSLAAMSAEKGKSEVINLKWDNAAGEVLDVYRSLVG